MKKRIIILFCIFSFFFFIVYFKVALLGISPTLKAVSNHQNSFSLEVISNRGCIYDYKFNSLVNNSPKTIGVLLPENEKEKPYLVDADNELNIPQKQLFKVFKRYNDDQLAPHIIGHFDSTKSFGVTGVEAGFNDFLDYYKTSTKISFFTNGERKLMENIPPQIKSSPLPKEGVVLTLDKEIQKICEKVGATKVSKGAIVVMEPSSGKLRAVASFPKFSPNNLAPSIADKENSPMINRAFLPFNVGSTFKIAVAAAALEMNISPQTTFECTGKIKIGNKTFKCHEGKGHGVLNMEQAMILSCNPYFINLGQMVGSKKLVQMASDMGFSKGYNLLPKINTQKGFLPSVSQLSNSGDLANLSFGQGDLLATPVQIAQMLSCIVNEGKTPTPTLLEGLTTDKRSLYNRPNNKELTFACSSKTAEQIKSYLVSAVYADNNEKSRPLTVGSGGKTGTAQTGKIVNGKEKVNAWFAGFCPAISPKYVIIVLVEDGKSGISSAAPVFAQIADEINKNIK